MDDTINEVHQGILTDTETDNRPFTITVISNTFIDVRFTNGLSFQLHLDDKNIQLNVFPEGIAQRPLLSARFA